MSEIIMFFLSTGVSCLSEAWYFGVLAFKA